MGNKKAKKGKKKKKANEGIDPIESRIIPVADIPTELKILLYGRSGTGKTTFIGTCPKPVLILDMKERGTDSVKQQPDVHRFLVKKWDDFEEIYWYLKEGGGKNKFKTIAIDTVTALQTIALRGLVGDDVGVLSKQTWGKAANLLTTWIMDFRELPGNIIFTAQDRESSSEDMEDEDHIIPEVGPRTMPSVAGILNACVGVIGNTFITEKKVKVEIKRKGKTKTVKRRKAKYCIRLGPNARYLTKFRKDPYVEDGITVPDHMVDPTYNKFLELLGEGEE